LAAFALLVSLATAVFTYVQTRSAEGQLRLADLQVRPYARLMPVFVRGAGDRLAVEEIEEDFSPVPARVIYSSMTPWIDGVNSGAFLFNRVGDILYGNRRAGQFLPDMPIATARLVIRGKARLEVGACIVYSSISQADPRRWEGRGFYSYQPGFAMPEVQMIREEEVPRSTTSCESRNLRSQWLALGVRPVR
jgi:hypothetical protein